MNNQHWKTISGCPSSGDLPSNLRNTVCKKNNTWMYCTNAKRKNYRHSGKKQWLAFPSWVYIYQEYIPMCFCGRISSRCFILAISMGLSDEFHLMWGIEKALICVWKSTCALGNKHDILGMLGIFRKVGTRQV